MITKQKRSCYYRATAFHSNLLTHYLEHVKIKIQRGAIVVDGLPLKNFSYKKVTVVSQAGGCFFALSEPIIYPRVKKEARTPKTPRNSKTFMDNTSFRQIALEGATLRGGQTAYRY